MSNICSNEFYALSNNSDNIKLIDDFLSIKFDADIEIAGDEIDANFDSDWCFPEEEMNELFELLPDKDDIYMRCLSVEYMTDYIDYHKCEDNTGWYNALNQ